jgi:hypothetical protein
MIDATMHETEHRVQRVDPPVRGITPVMVVALGVAFTAAVVGTVTRGTVSRYAGGVAVAVIAAAPLVRVAMLGIAWWHRHDRRYALVALGLLLVVAAGAGLALLR